MGLQDTCLQHIALESTFNFQTELHILYAPGTRWLTIFLLYSLSFSDMRRDVQEIFRATPHHKQVMMFSATLAKEIRATCKKFMANVRTSFGESSKYEFNAVFVLAVGDLRR
jgi:hypothetical protein